MSGPNEFDPPRNRGDRDDDRDRDRGRDRADDDWDDRPRRRRGSNERSGGDPPNGAATAGLILGILGFCTVGLTALPAIICSAIGLSKPGGRGKAMTGLILGCIGLLFGPALAIALLLPAVQKTREAAARMKDQNNLKMIGLGMHSYANSNADALPPNDEKVSWRVHILPHIEQSNLSRRYDQKQAWDSATNRPLANERVLTYVSASDPPETVETHYRVFVGPGTLYDPVKPVKGLRDVSDGLSFTFFAIEAGETVPWTQPKELFYDRNGPLPALGLPSRNVVQVVMMDGSVKTFSKNTAPDVIRGGIEPNDGKRFTGE